MKKDSSEASQTSYQRSKERLKRRYEKRVVNTGVLAHVKRWCKWLTLNHLQILHYNMIK